MDMSWQALLQEAAATSFEKTADTLAAAENDNCACIDLHQQQIHELSKKILLLPHQGRVLLLSRYCFRLSPEETEMFFHLENAKGHFRFYKELLSSSMGVEAGCMISDDTFVKACHIALRTASGSGVRRRVSSVLIITRTSSPTTSAFGRLTAKAKRLQFAQKPLSASLSRMAVSRAVLLLMGMTL